MADHSEAVDDDVPPLEDMSEELERAKTRMKTTSSKEASAKTPTTNIVTPSQTDPTPQATADKSVAAESSDAGKSTNSPPSTFGGFKKGFLSSKPSKVDKSRQPMKTKSTPSTSSSPSSAEKKQDSNTSSASSSDGASIPFVKPKKEERAKLHKLRFPEVQRALRESYPYMNSKEWVTDDLLAKIEEHPVLRKAFVDPYMSKVVAELQKNPESVAEKAKDSKEIQTFLAEFSKLMDEHFAELARRKELAARGIHLPETPKLEDDEVMKERIERPEVAEVMKDPDILRLIIALRGQPEEAQRIFKTATGEFRRKIQTLIDNEVLAIRY